MKQIRNEITLSLNELPEVKHLGMISIIIDRGIYDPINFQIEEPFLDIRQGISHTIRFFIGTVYDRNK